jgi:hypothetical protein
MMQVIYNSRLPVDKNDGGQGYAVDIKCGSDQDQECTSSVLAVTNAKPGESTVSRQLHGPNLLIPDNMALYTL